MLPEYILDSKPPSVEDAFLFELNAFVLTFCDICKYVSLFSKITKINRFTVGKLGFCTNDLNRISNVLQSKMNLRRDKKRHLKCRLHEIEYRSIIPLMMLIRYFYFGTKNEQYYFIKVKTCICFFEPFTETNESLL